MEEEWREIPGFPGYEASDTGRVRSFLNTQRRRVERPKVLCPYIGKSGYASVALNNKTQWVHRLVLLAFGGAPSSQGLECCHINGVRADNRASNLRWGTRIENRHDSLRHATRARGERSPQAKLTETMVVQAAIRVADGESQASVARSMGVSQPIISRAIRGLNWRHVGL
jgi:hypothetical protein